MAIKISGTDVIDNSRNIVNATAGTFSGTVTAGGFSGPAAGLTGIPAAFIGVNAATYTSPGTFVVGTNCPPTVTTVKISCMGGGGNGGATPAPQITGSGAGGGASGVLAVRWYPLTGTPSLTITVGGAGGTSSVTVTGPGATVISSTGGAAGGYPTGGAATPLTQTNATFCYPGLSGGSTNPVTKYIGVAANPAGSIVPLGSPTSFVTASFNGGGFPGHAIVSAPPTPTGTTGGQGGRGGSSVLGIGGTGGAAGPPPIAAPRLGGNASGFGAGGGGGGGKIATPALASTGGTGSPGIVFIEF